jgi:hypothetical protein
MWILPVAIGALLKRQSFLEVPCGVTLYALHLGMLAKQGKLRPGMVKCPIHLRRRSLFPARGSVTGLTCLRKAATVGIGMAIVAAAKWDFYVARQFVWTQSVTLLARYLEVQTGKGITRKRMVKLTNIDLVPLGEVVTLQAVGPEPALMPVLMAVDAVGGNSQKCFAQIFNFDGQAFFLGYVFWRMAMAAAGPCMLTLKLVAGLVMVEGLNIPFCQDKIFAVVFGMTACAFQT